MVLAMVSPPLMSSPRAWGCFYSSAASAAWAPVFPTCVGVFPKFSTFGGGFVCLPHVRGGVSPYLAFAVMPGKSSPRAWGCFFEPINARQLKNVFPTCVGVFLPFAASCAVSLRLPHVRGGVSLKDLEIQQQAQSSPRAWGCFSGHGATWATSIVFPTCVGVFLRVPGVPLHPGGLPHVRGGVSHHHDSRRGMGGSSPRAWGCFSDVDTEAPLHTVFPTCVGVFPRREA